MRERVLSPEQLQEETEILAQLLARLHADGDVKQMPWAILDAQVIKRSLAKINPSPSQFIHAYIPILSEVLAAPDEVVPEDITTYDTRPLIRNTHVLMQLEPVTKNLLDQEFKQADPLDAFRYQLFSDFVEGQKRKDKDDERN